MAVTTFSLMLITGAFQARSVTGTVFTAETFDNRHLNWTALAELVARRAHHADGRHAHASSGPRSCRSTQWVLALVPAVALFFLWELGKLVARRGTEPASQPVPAEESAT